MLNQDDLWVGDELKLKRSGRKGSFLGLAKDGRLRVKVGDKVLLVYISGVEAVPEEKLNQKLIDLKEETLKERLGYERLESQIDLHIEKLNPSLVHAVPERIIDVQLKAFEAYMEGVVDQKMKFVTIVHGKGTGVLKTAIQASLQSMEEVNHYISVNGGGATEVVMR